MRYILYYAIFIISSCQSKNSPSLDNERKADTSASMPIIDSSNAIKADELENSWSTYNSKNDTIFLGFKIGMTSFQFEKHKKDLIQKKKLQISDQVLLYQIKVDENDFEETFSSSPEHEIQKKIWTGNGVVIPEFFNDKLISIKIKFVNTRGNDVYGSFVSSLDDKYYKSTPKIYNATWDDTKVEALEIGNSFTGYEWNSWTLKDINISLRFNFVIQKVADKKVKSTDNVTVKYWSKYYYNQKQNQEIDKGRKETKEVENDL